MDKGIDKPGPYLSVPKIAISQGDPRVSTHKLKTKKVSGLDSLSPKQTTSGEFKSDNSAAANMKMKEDVQKQMSDLSGTTSLPEITRGAPNQRSPRSYRKSLTRDQSLLGNQTTMPGILSASQDPIQPSPKRSKYRSIAELCRVGQGAIIQGFGTNRTDRSTIENRGTGDHLYPNGDDITPAKQDGYITSSSKTNSVHSSNPDQTNRGISRISQSGDLSDTTDILSSRTSTSFSNKTPTGKIPNSLVSLRRSFGSKNQSVSRRSRSDSNSLGDAASRAHKRRHIRWDGKSSRSGTISEEELAERREQARTRIRCLFRLARVCCGLATYLRRRSIARNDREGVTMLYFYSACGTDADGASTTLIFDKAEYSRSKGIRLPLAARRVATKAPACRTDEDVQVLYRVMNSLRGFKEKYPETIKWRMAKVAWYVNCESSRVVVRQGHRGLNFYFIYSGAVFVQLETRDAASGKVKTSVESVIPSGVAFGEIALLQAGGTRTVSIVCREPTELFQIDKDAFQDICTDLYFKELQFKLSIAQGRPQFSYLTEARVSDMCYQSVLLTVPIGSVIEKDWAAAKHVYIVVEGKVQLMREIDESDIDDESVLLATTPNPKNPRASLTLMHDLAVGNMQSSLQGNHETSLAKWATERTQSGHVVEQRRHNMADARVPRRPPRRKFLTVGMMTPGDATDFRILDPTMRRQVDPVAMVSQGAKVLRVSVKLIEQLAPRLALEQYIRTEYIPFEVPDKIALHDRYMRILHWDRVKERFHDTLTKEKQGHAVSMIPSSRKSCHGLNIML